MIDQQQYSEKVFIMALSAGHTDENVLPAPDQIYKSRSKLLPSLPHQGLGDVAIKAHLYEDIIPGLNRSFVTGGATPSAAFADHIAVDYDQNVAVHLPDQTVATDVEDRALCMLCDLVELDASVWIHRTLTTGATASNVLGLACGREFVIRQAAVRHGKEASVAEHGLVQAMQMAEVQWIQVLTTAPHSSLKKAASIIGLGRASIIDVGTTDHPHRFDFDRLRDYLQRPGMSSIVAVSCAEVNSGLFATNHDDMRTIRKLCDQYSAWIHVDAAFGLLARILPDISTYHSLLEGTMGMELADSISSDGHKLLNVPYDCGIFLSRHLAIGMEVFQNPNAAYLEPASKAAATVDDRAVPSPLNIGIENSRRFRGLAVYATLAAYGRDGYREMLERQIKLARAIASFMLKTPGYELLPLASSPHGVRLSDVFVVVLFRAMDETINRDLVQRINSSRKIYVSGTQWNGKPAARFAVANWQVNVDRDMMLIRDVLREALT